MRFTVSNFVLMLFLLLGSNGTAHAAQLVMMEQQGCAWCIRWHNEIGGTYPKTDEAKRAPLRTIDINKPLPDDLAWLRVERFTPSFVLVEGDQEIGRIRGYPGDEFFWFLLNEMLDELPKQPM